MKKPELKFLTDFERYQAKNDKKFKQVQKKADLLFKKCQEKIDVLYLKHTYECDQAWEAYKKKHHQ